MPSPATEKPKPRRRLRELPARVIGRTPWLRRRYARRLLKTIEKSRKKHRPLPENLEQIERQLRRVAPPKRAEILEQMLEYGASSDANLSRELRRASNRQERRSGKGGGTRPGLPPGQRRRPG